MSRVHEILHWANRRAVAEEVTRRGYRVSGETLNRWVRDEKEFPAVVERIVLDLFGIEKTAPDVPRRLDEIETKLDAVLANQQQVANSATVKIIEALAPPDRLERVSRLIDRLEALPPPSGEASDDPPAEEDRVGESPTDPGLS